MKKHFLTLALIVFAAVVVYEYWKRKTSALAGITSQATDLSNSAAIPGGALN